MITVDTDSELDYSGTIDTSLIGGDVGNFISKNAAISVGDSATCLGRNCGWTMNSMLQI